MLDLGLIGGPRRAEDVSPPVRSPIKRHTHSAVRRLIALAAALCLLLVPKSATAQSQPLQPIAPNSGPEVAASTAPATAEQPSTPPQAAAGLPDVDQMLSPDGLSATLQLMLLLTVLSLAPSILIMTTCFIRFVVVLSLLRQALGTQQLPPNQVIISLCLFLTFMVMSPVWHEAYDQGIAPYTHNQPLPGQQPGEDRLTRAFRNTAEPLRRFLSDQIEMTGNSDAVWMFLEFQRPAPDTPAAAAWAEPETYEDLSLTVLLPSYMLSELKTAFIIGFQIYLPFLIIDMVISAVLISMGMMMLPPVLISLPFKLLLFVMIDGWHLTVGMLLESVRPIGG